LAFGRDPATWSLNNGLISKNVADVSQEGVACRRYGLEARRVLSRIQARTASNVLVMILPLMPCGIAES